MIGRVASVVRLVTFVDVRDKHDGGPDGSTMSVSARHEAVLADGRRVPLLDDRGWTAALFHAAADGTRHRLTGIWATQTREAMESTARAVVGPDEAFGGRTQAEEEAGHWDFLARTLHEEGVEIDAAELRELPHDVELGDRVLARLDLSPEQGSETRRPAGRARRPPQTVA
jgi:hypothetical protein